MSLASTLALWLGVLYFLLTFTAGPRLDRPIAVVEPGGIGGLNHVRGDCTLKYVDIRARRPPMHAFATDNLCSTEFPLKIGYTIRTSKKWYRTLHICCPPDNQVP